MGRWIVTALPGYSDPTLDALRSEMEREGNRPNSGYGRLGGGVLGRECDRMLWYHHRRIIKQPFDHETLALFEDGHRTEDLLVNRLRKVSGVKVYTEGDDHKQFGFSLLNGHLPGFVDGVVVGLLQAPVTPHVLECKAVTERKFDDFVKKREEHGGKAALLRWNEVYFVQAQIYMGAMGLTRHYLMIGTPGGRKMETCRTEFDPRVYDAYYDRAQRIINMPEPPRGIGQKPSFYKCKYCDFHSACFDDVFVPDVHCKTCLWSKPQTDEGGEWLCTMHGQELRNYKACEDHLFMPSLLRGFTFRNRIDGDPIAIQYVRFDGQSVINSKNEGESSADIKASVT